MNWLQKTANMSIEDIPNFLQDRGSIAYLRYVRVNGEYRFADVTAYGIDHTGLANGDPVESAGFVKIRPEGFYVEGYSMMLKIGPAVDDEENLSRLLNLPIQDRHA